MQYLISRNNNNNNNNNSIDNKINKIVKMRITDEFNTLTASDILYFSASLLNLFYSESKVLYVMLLKSKFACRLFVTSDNTDMVAFLQQKKKKIRKQEKCPL